MGTEHCQRYDRPPVRHKPLTQPADAEIIASTAKPWQTGDVPP
jgi:hypothetical protein